MGKNQPLLPHPAEVRQAMTFSWLRFEWKRALAINQQGMHAPAVGTQHLYTQVADGEHFVALGQATELMDHQTAYGIEVLVGIGGTKSLIEGIDFGSCLDAETAGVVAHDI